jgi:septal ring factor EnvC (AmiA/AmiB activator)
MDDWNNVVTAAMKVLGDKGKIPKFSPAIPKAGTADEKTYEEFKKVRDELKKKLLATQDSGEALKDAIEQYQDDINENDLGLNARDKDDAKKIAAARKILSDRLQESIDLQETNGKNLRELDRHLMSLMNYKQGS